MMLGEYLLAQGGKRRMSGQFDCCTFPADWVVARLGIDPMQWWRGTYSTEEEALEVIENAGSLAGLFTEGFNACNVECRTGDWQEGDVGVIRVGEHEAGAIYCGKRWAFVADRGLGFASIDPECIMKVWAVG